MKTTKILGLLALTSLLTACCGSSQQSEKYSRGLGIYPGNLKESFAPTLEVDRSTYRNVALLKAVYQSSSYDYNLTGQLVTDGIIDYNEPATISFSNQDGRLPKNEQEYLFDTNYYSSKTLEGNDILIQLDLENWSVDADRMWLDGRVQIDPNGKRGYEITTSASVDGEQWEIIAQERSAGLPPRDLNLNVNFDNNGYRHYRIEMNAPAAQTWQLRSWDFFKDNELLSVLPSGQFTSTWKSATAGEEWVYVDFGAPASYDKVQLSWINKAITGCLQASDDAQSWKEIASLPGGDEREDFIEVKGKSRYLRLLVNESENGKPYELSEMQVFGRGGLVAKPHQPLAETSEELNLSGGNWRLKRASEVKADGATLSKEGYDDSAWIPATVPGTVLSSYVNAGIVPDPNFADNQLQISESYFLSDFWYRNEFEVKKTSERTFLNFDGINWKAKVWLNGQSLGEVDGAFIRGQFDVTDLIVKGKNVLAVQIIKNAHPGAVKEQTAFSSEINGGILGADNATYHASIGWDWIPTIRGRNIGIWNDVRLTHTGLVTLHDPFVRSELPLPDTTSARVFVEVEVKNHANHEVSGIVKGKLGDVKFQKTVQLAALEKQTVKFNADDTPQLLLKNPKLWWPNGYGEQHLYDVNLTFELNGKTSDQKGFKTGIRQMNFDEDEYEYTGIPDRYGRVDEHPHRLSIYVNGRRFIGFGGNWGFSESNLNYRGREYDAAVHNHAQMNFTMIRDWVGQIGDEEFYEACDKYGIMIWQDFWLANPADGPDPYYEDLFTANASDYLKRIRNHPAIALYVGRNEGNPPASIDNYLREIVAAEHPGLHYISHSAAGVVSGEGPYRALPYEDYFHLYGHDKFHSERGMPNVMNYESMMRAFGANHIEPVNSLETPNYIYGMHDYTLGGPSGPSAQATASFNEMIERAFGKPHDAKQFAEWAQWINYNGYRAMFEGRAEHRRGLLLWMSHPAWPSMTWQTYDYYFEPTAAYFGCMKACEPLHILWNALTNEVSVVNYHAGNQQGLTARVQLINQDGTEVWKSEQNVNINEDQTLDVLSLEGLELSAPLSETHFIKLTLLKGEEIVSDNFYTRGLTDKYSYKSLLQLPKVEISNKMKMEQKGGEWVITGELQNTDPTPALMIRLNVVGSKSGEQLLPVFYSDNYFSLMPGEKKNIRITLSDFDTHGEKPLLKIEGFNL